MGITVVHLDVELIYQDEEQLKKYFYAKRIMISEFSNIVHLVIKCFSDKVHKPKRTGKDNEATKSIWHLYV